MIAAGLIQMAAAATKATIGESLIEVRIDNALRINE